MRLTTTPTDKINRGMCGVQISSEPKLEREVGRKEVGYFGEYGALPVRAICQYDEKTAFGSELVVED